jgi:hypothetical protein
MSRMLSHRLNKLEQRSAPAPTLSKCHWFIVESDEELAQRVAELKASPGWSEGDRIIARVIVDPPQRMSA